MIESKTVFILGAGASAAYGFPIGKELTRKILDINIEKAHKAANNPPGETHSPYWEYIFNKCSKNNIFEFFEALRKSGKTSVDAFIEHRPEFLVIGKILISQELVKCELERNLFPHNSQQNIEDHWYEYIWGRLNTNYEDLDNNNVSFITFNYDRSLEYYLLTCMKYTYGKSEEEIAEKLQSIPIIHLYGALGYLPIMSKGNNIRDFGEGSTPEVVEICINSIKIIHEGVDLEKDVEFNKAYKLISDADIICFLGFGYDETNLSRLKLRDLLTSRQVLLGSAYGFVNAEIDKIKSLVNTVRSRTIRVDETGKLQCHKYLRSIANYI